MSQLYQTPTQELGHLRQTRDCGQVLIAFEGPGGGQQEGYTGEKEGQSDERERCRHCNEARNTVLEINITGGPNTNIVE